MIDSSGLSVSTPLPAAGPVSELPFAAFQVSADEGAALRVEYEQQVVTCAERFGVKLIPVLEDARSVDQASMMWAGTFGMMPLRHAEQFGYHAQPGEPFQLPETVFVREDESPRVDVIYGTDSTLRDRKSGKPVPSGGCRGAAIRAMGFDALAIDPPETADIRLEALRDGRTSEAMRNWSNCMTEQGFEYETVDGPVDEVLGIPLTDRERAVAVADVRCTQVSRWYDIAFDLQGQMQAAEVDRRRDYFESRMAAQRRQLASMRRQ